MAGIVHELEQKGLHEQVRQEAANAAAQLAEVAHLHKGQIVVVGCSTSEVVGKKVGSWSTPEIANAIFEGLHSVFGPMGVYIAAQCCEHLNRAIIVEHDAVPNGEIVNVVPQPKAGSSFATAAYQAFKHPVALEEIRADAGLDIGGTLIGMHLKKVAVPVRLAQDHIGDAILLAARVRPKFIGGDRAVYLLIDVLGVVIWATVFYGLNAALHFPFLTDTMTAVSIALMNTLFRLATLVVLFPLIGAMERLVVFLFPDTGLIAEEQDMDRLEERFLQHPALSIEQSRLVTNSMAERAAGNLLDAMALRTNYSEKALQNVEETESLIDRYEDKLGTYLMKITSRSLSATQSEEVSKFLHTISDFERISDHALNISQTAKEIHDKEVEFSAAALHELDVMESALREILEVAIEAFVSNDIQQAARVEPLEEIIDGLCDEMKSHHVVRLQSGVCTLGQGFIFNDLLTNYERVADHCSNIAVAIIELESDSFDTHEYLSSVRAMKSHSFARYYEEYQEKYHL